jgi:GH43 family beta-xylosidase
MPKLKILHQAMILLLLPGLISGPTVADTQMASHLSNPNTAVIAFLGFNESALAPDSVISDKEFLGKVTRRTWLRIFAAGAAMALFPSVRSQTSNTSATPQTFTNPLFASQDPYITFWEGNYYFTDSHDGIIWIRKSPTLTGFAQAASIPVWTAPNYPNVQPNIYAPQMHVINGRCYIYFSADYQNNGQHRLYVLQGGSNPLDPYVPGDTVGPNGQIVESTDGWAIDPNVFYGLDGQLYLLFSGTVNPTGQSPQRLFIAPMSGPTQVNGPSVLIGKPTELWETRGGSIEERPIAFVHDGQVIVMYAASASFIPNYYAVGALVNETGNLLDPNAWTKKGPLFDHHGTTYGPGGVAFALSPDGTELWFFYEAYDSTTCAAWGCRSIRAQKVLGWNKDGTPILGYPFNPGVPQSLPSGDVGWRTGWGDSRKGAPASGVWIGNNPTHVEKREGPGGELDRIFRGDVDMFSYTVSARMEALAASLVSLSTAEMGLYAFYYDEANFVMAFIDPILRLFVTQATVSGVEQPSNAQQLPASFDTKSTHTISVHKTAAGGFTFFLDGTIMDRRNFLSLVFGQIGVFGSVNALFTDVIRTDTSQGWSNAFGDIAEGLPRSATPQAVGDGYVQGGWEISDASTVKSIERGIGWHTLYQGGPNYPNYTVQVDARASDTATAMTQAKYGLIVGHDDRNNQASLWVDMPNNRLIVKAMVGGIFQSWDAPLPNGFDPTQFHTLKAEKVGPNYAFSLDGDPMLQLKIVLQNGAGGVVTDDTLGEFQNYSFTPAQPTSTIASLSLGPSQKPRTGKQTEKTRRGTIVEAPFSKSALLPASLSTLNVRSRDQKFMVILDLTSPDKLNKEEREAASWNLENRWDTIGETDDAKNELLKELEGPGTSRASIREFRLAHINGEIEGVMKLDLVRHRVAFIEIRPDISKSPRFPNLEMDMRVAGVREILDSSKEGNIGLEAVNPLVLGELVSFLPGQSFEQADKILYLTRVQAKRLVAAYGMRVREMTNRYPTAEYSLDGAKSTYRPKPVRDFAVVRESLEEAAEGVILGVLQEWEPILHILSEELQHSLRQLFFGEIEEDVVARLAIASSTNGTSSKVIAMIESGIEEIMSTRDNLYDQMTAKVPKVFQYAA